MRDKMRRSDFDDDDDKEKRSTGITKVVAKAAMDGNKDVDALIGIWNSDLSDADVVVALFGSGSFLGSHSKEYGADKMYEKFRERGKNDLQNLKDKWKID